MAGPRSVGKHLACEEGRPLRTALTGFLISELRASADFRESFPTRLRESTPGLSVCGRMWLSRTFFSSLPAGTGFAVLTREIFKGDKSGLGCTQLKIAFR